VLSLRTSVRVHWLEWREGRGGKGRRAFMLVRGEVDVKAEPEPEPEALTAVYSHDYVALRVGLSLSSIPPCQTEMCMKIRMNMKIL
jgi:hypothetical protein